MDGDDGIDDGGVPALGKVRYTFDHHEIPDRACLQRRRLSVPLRRSPASPIKHHHTAANHHADVVDAQLVSYVAIVGEVEDQDIGALADFEAAAIVPAAGCISGIDGGGRKCLIQGHAMTENGEFHGGLHAVAWALLVISAGQHRSATGFDEVGQARSARQPDAPDREAGGNMAAD